MSPSDGLRWGWTILTFLGLLFAIWNLREAILDEWALIGAGAAARLSAQGVAWDQGVKVVLHAANFIAGVSAIAGFGMGALAGLIISALAAIYLSYGQMQRHRALLETLRRQG